jgi:hypothetical protein
MQMREMPRAGRFGIAAERNRFEFFVSDFRFLVAQRLEASEEFVECGFV